MGCVDASNILVFPSSSFLTLWQELDYENEARNQKHFQQELKARGCKVKVPNVYDEYTTERVLTSEWIQGVKLTDSSPEKIRELIPVGVELFLTQLFDIGAFHADPHPGTVCFCTVCVLCFCSILDSCSLWIETPGRDDFEFCHLFDLN